MRTQIEDLIKQSKHLDAATALLRYVEDHQIDDIKEDIIVIQSRLNELKKQEKRRRISVSEAQDARITLGYDLLDLVDTLPEDHNRNPGGAANAGINAPPAEQPATPSQVNQIPPAINIVINNENRNENHISIEIHNEVQALASNLNELKSELKSKADPQAKAAVKEVESLESQLEGLVGAKTKDAVMPYINKVQGFLKKLESGNDLTAKAIKQTKKGAEIIGKLCKNYNQIAPWVGMPSVPPVLLGSD
ncbi:MAG: hypothetical protein K6L81_15410 [Agarilytica sp.]